MMLVSLMVSQPYFSLFPPTGNKEKYSWLMRLGASKLKAGNHRGMEYTLPSPHHIDSCPEHHLLHCNRIHTAQYGNTNLHRWFRGLFKHIMFAGSFIACLFWVSHPNGGQQATKAWWEQALTKFAAPHYQCRLEC